MDNLLRAQLRLMHQPRTGRPSSCCVQCGTVSPCATIRLLDSTPSGLPDYLRALADDLDESEELRNLTDEHMQDVYATTNEIRRRADEMEGTKGNA